MPSLIGSTIPNGLKRVLGRAGYVIWAAWCVLRFRPFQAVLTTPDGLSRQFDAVELRIANGRYLGGAEIAEEAEVARSEKRRAGEGVVSTFKFRWQPVN